MKGNLFGLHWESCLREGPGKPSQERMSKNDASQDLGPRSWLKSGQTDHQGAHETQGWAVGKMLPGDGSAGNHVT